MRRVARGAGVAIAIAATACPTAAQAQGDARITEVVPEPGPPRVLLLIDDADAGIVKRLRGELGALGFELVTAPMRQPSRTELSDAAREAEAVAALLVHASDAGVEVWISDRVTGKTVLREVVTSEVGDPRERDALIALRSVELLRASLLEVQSSLPSRGDVAPPVAVREASRTALPPPAPPPAAEPPRLWLGAAGVFAWGRGASPTGHVALVAGGPVGRWLSLEGSLVAPTAPLGLEGPEGSASVSISTATCGADLNITAPDNPFGVRVGAGLGASWLHIRATAAPPFTATSDDLFTAYPHGRLALSWAPLPRLRLVLAARVGATGPQPVVQFASRETLRYGRPLLLVSLGPEVGFF